MEVRDQNNRKVTPAAFIEAHGHKVVRVTETGRFLVIDDDGAECKVRNSMEGARNWLGY